MEIPDRMKKFPLWRGKYPIHYTVMTHDGIPDFKVMHEHRRIEAFGKNLCHLCGERMQPPFALIGGIKCLYHHTFVDGPMHEECARYAAAVCPFLNTSRAKYSKKTGDPIDRPVQMFLCLTSKYKTELNPGGSVSGNKYYPNNEGSGIQALNPLASGQIVVIASDWLEVHEIQTDLENDHAEETLVRSGSSNWEGEIPEEANHKEGPD